jgi:serine O-acetyltransferase
MALSLSIKDAKTLSCYVAKQLDAFVPNRTLGDDLDIINLSIYEALERMRPILSSVRAFKNDYFNHFNSLQYTTFLYLLANQCYLDKANPVILDRLFYLNRIVNSVDLYYSVILPNIFFISHGLGLVAGNAQYGNKIVFFQNVTIGRVGTNTPKLGNNIVIYPGASVTGSSVIGNNCTIAAGVQVHNINVPDNSTVKLINGNLSISRSNKNYCALYFSD